jgi:hypothetical protein
MVLLFPNYLYLRATISIKHFYRNMVSFRYRRYVMLLILTVCMWGCLIVLINSQNNLLKDLTISTRSCYWRWKNTWVLNIFRLLLLLKRRWIAILDKLTTLEIWKVHSIPLIWRRIWKHLPNYLVWGKRPMMNTLLSTRASSFWNIAKDTQRNWGWSSTIRYFILFKVNKVRRK